MNTPLSPDTGNRREPCYGADIAEYGSIVVAEYRDGIAATACRYPAVTDGAAALRERIGRTSTRVRVCIRSCGAAALSVAVALMARSTAEVTLIAPRAVASFGRARPSAAPFGTAESARAAGEAPDMSVVVLHVCPVCNREHRVAPARGESPTVINLCVARTAKRSGGDACAQYPRLPCPVSACAPALGTITMADPDSGHRCAAQHAPRHIYAVFTRPALQCSPIDSSRAIETSPDDMDARRRKSSRAAIVGI